MPYPRTKQESFEGFGGINTKASPYLTGLNECLDLQNFDFSSPGALSQRWGTTQYTGNTVTGRVLGLFEYERLDGYSSVVLNTAAGMWYNFGSSFYPLYLSAEGASFSLGLVGGQTMFVPAGSSPVIPSFSTNLFEYRTFVNTIFFSNGSSGSFQMFQGESLYPTQSLTQTINFSYLYGLPSGTSAIGTSMGMNAGGATGLYQFGMGWLDIFGFRSAPALLTTGVSFTGTSLNNFNISFSSSLIPWDYGVTAVTLYMTNPNGTQLFAYDERNFVQLVGGPNGVSYAIDPRIAFGAPGGIYATLTTTIRPDIFPALWSQTIPAQYPLYFTLAPRFLEIYNNQVFMAGFTSYTSAFSGVGVTTTANYQSRMYWSDVGDPEFVDPTFFDEVRTNDGDRITGLKNYQNNMLIFKQRSFHSLFGNSATDVNVSQISDQYGAISNKCIISYNQQLLFLDRKGIIRYDGANISVASDKIEPIFYRMNLSAANDTAVGIHFKKRNEVWFAIPVDGATQNNLVIVYDYIADAWTTFTGFVPSCMGIAKGYLNDYVVFYGSYSGAIYNFGASLPSDAGSAVTLVYKSLFYRGTNSQMYGNMGNTVEKQFRRLYVDSNIMAAGSTLQVDMIPDQGTSIYATRYMAMGTFQNRIDFGIPAKTLSFKFTYASATLPIKINGITPESRFQRDT